jgi:putative tryptophan/tyrosine transport system substrate-binding protein
MRRREFIAGLGSVTASPLAARAQQVIPVVGFLSAVSPDGFGERTRGFRQGLKEVGFSEGENVLIDYRWADNQLDRLPALAGELVRKRVAVIVATGGTAPAIAATDTIPIVFTIPEDPVVIGLVASLSRPGSNLTGINLFVGELMSKRLELFREIVPGITRVAVFVNSANPTRAELQAKEAESAGAALTLQVQILKVATAHEIGAAFALLAKNRPDALFVSPDPFFIGRRVQFSTQAARHAIPTSFSTRDFPEAGGLMSYGTNIVDAYRQAGTYTGQILKGSKPADMPVVQATKFELVINTETARILGLAIPSSLLARADEVIE